MRQEALSEVAEPRGARELARNRVQVLGIVVLVIASIEVGVLWGALSNMTGMLLRAREAVIGVYTFFMLPLMFL